MAKSIGNTRLFKPTKASISQSRKDYTRQLSQATTDVSYSYFSEDTGGFMIFMKGHNPQQEEIEVARYLADFGLQVYLTPEGGGYEMYATHSYVKDGKTYYKFSDGKINISTFEQRTPAKIETTIEQSVH